MWIARILILRKTKKMPTQGTYAAWQQSTPVNTNFGDIVSSQLSYLAKYRGEQEANRARALLEAQKQAAQRRKDYQAFAKDYKLELPDVSAYSLDQASQVISNAAAYTGELTQRAFNLDPFSEEYASVSTVLNNVSNTPNYIKYFDDAVVSKYQDYNEKISKGEIDDILGERASMFLDSLTQGQFQLTLGRDGITRARVYVPGYGNEMELTPEEFEKVWNSIDLEAPVDVDKWFQDLYITYDTVARDNGYNSTNTKQFAQSRITESINSQITGTGAKQMPREILKAFMSTHTEDGQLHLTPEEVYGTGEQATAKLKSWVRDELVRKRLAGMTDYVSDTSSDPTLAARIRNLDANTRKAMKEAVGPQVLVGQGVIRQGTVESPVLTYNFIDKQGRPEEITIGYERDETGRQMPIKIRGAKISSDGQSIFAGSGENTMHFQEYPIHSNIGQQILGEISRRDKINTPSQIIYE